MKFMLHDINWLIRVLLDFYFEAWLFSDKRNTTVTFVVLSTSVMFVVLVVAMLLVYFSVKVDSATTIL